MGMSILDVVVLAGDEPPSPERMARVLGGLAPPRRVTSLGGGVTLAAANPALGAALADGTSGAPLVLLVGAGCAPLPGAVAALVEALRERPGAGAAGGLVLSPRGSFRASFGSDPSLAREILAASGLGQRLYGPWFPSHGLHESAELGPVETVSGACLLVRREALAATGLFDPQLAEPDTTVDWCFRLRRAGWDLLFVPGAPVLCEGDETEGDRATAARRLRSRVRLLRRVRGHAAAAGLKVVLAGLALLGRAGPLTPAQLGQALRDA